MFHATVAPKSRSMQPSATRRSGRKRNIRMLTHGRRMVLNLTMGEWAAVACSNSEGSWKATRSYLRKGRMEVFDAELWVMWIVLKETAKRGAGNSDIQRLPGRSSTCSTSRDRLWTATGTMDQQRSTNPPE